MAERRYWDASVFLANIKNEEGRGPTTEEIVQSALRGECWLATSAVSLVEVVRPGRRGQIQMTADRETAIRNFFRNPFIKVVDFTAALSAEAREYQWRFGLHVRDAIHLASAVHAKAEVLETYDGDLLDVDWKSIDGCPEIRTPSWPQLPLVPNKTAGS